MSEHSNQQSNLSPLKRALLTLEKMQAEIDAMKRAGREPIAIVGMGCRFPGGGSDLEAFWRLLRDGVDTVTEVPPERWDIGAYYDPDPDARSKMTTRYGAFLSGLDRFDAAFFGISPREAVSLDPQQRLLLEVAWEALENAGQAPDKLSGSRTGVFVGIINEDYANLQLAGGGLADIDAYFSSGTTNSMASGRLSYVFGLQGPSMSVDTSCSSSLVALHLACQSLRNGECRMALAGGTNVMLIPDATIALSRYKMLAPDGHCKTFDARADGYVRGEGCGVVVLKRLTDALADGDSIATLIRGTAVNQDGPSSGLTVPNGPAQEALIREALSNAGIKPSQISYVECHGTGTSLGDPIEVQALSAVLSQGRVNSSPVYIGSVKTNIGHLEPAAGIAGLIKAVLCLQHKEIPPHLNLREPSPFIPWKKLPVVIPTELTPWPAGAPLIAGVSSFGFSGTNAHVVLEAAPEPERVAADVERPSQILSLSARGENALRELADRFASYLATHPAALFGDVCFTANVGRAGFTHRLAVLADTTAQAHERLTAFASGQDRAEVIQGRVRSPDQPKIAFLFTGQGSQYVGMGRRLYDTQPTFRRALERCDEILRPWLDVSLLELLYPGQESEVQSSRLDETGYTQPVLFALEYGLAELWRSWGIVPSVVMGHSVGEYVAACVAGVFSLEDGLRLIAERGRLMQGLPRRGQMAAVFADEARVAESLKPYANQASIAAINGPNNTVISGDEGAVQAVLDRLLAEGVKSRRLMVSHAFHSPLMEPMLDAFEEVASRMTYSSPTKKLYSNVTGRAVQGAEVSHAGYWRHHVREPVRFAEAMEALHEQGYELFLEVGPSQTLLGMGRACLPEGTGVWLPSLRRDGNDWQQMLHTLGELYVRGLTVDWAGFDRDYPRRHVSLPTYPFQRKRYWVDKPRTGTARTSPNIARHPLLGQRLRSALKEIQFESQLAVDDFHFLDDHRVLGSAILPATAYIELARAAATETFGPGSHGLDDMVIHDPLPVEEGEERAVQIILNSEEDGKASFQVFSLRLDKGAEPAKGEPSWRFHASGKIGIQRRDTESVPPPRISLEDLRVRCSEGVIPAEAHYDQLHRMGFQFGPSLRGVVKVWRGKCEALGRIRLPEVEERQPGAYQFPPALLDACLQFLWTALPDEVGSDTYLPFSFDSIQFYSPFRAELWSHASVRSDKKANRDTFTGDVRIFDDAGEPVAEVRGLSFRRVGREVFVRAKRDLFDKWFYEVAWEPKAKDPVGAVKLTQDQIRSAGDLTPPRQIAEHLELQIEPLIGQHALEQHHQLVCDLSTVSVAYILKAFQELGLEFRLGQNISVDSLVRQLGILNRYQRLLARLLEILTEEGVLVRVGSAWEVCGVPDEADPQALLAAISARHPTTSKAPSLVLMTRCGQHLAEALTGAADPLALLFPDGSLELAERIYSESPEALVFNTLVQEAIVSALAALPADRTVRILEIGAGTGGVSSFVLSKLPADRTEYFFTDISPLFLAKAEQKFSNYNYVKYELCNIERDPVAQGFAPHHFDVVIASNVLHATADLRQTLHNVQRVLAPEGLLVLMEGTAPERWVDLTFGLTDGWWAFSDTELRPSYPLVSRQTWLGMLTEVGFTDAVAAPRKSDLSGQAVVLARGPRTATDVAARGNWLIFADSCGVGQQLAELLRLRGESCQLVSAGSTFESVGTGHWRINPGGLDDFQQLLSEAVVCDAGSIQGVVHLWSLDAEAASARDGTSLEPSQLLSSGSLLHLVQVLGKVSTSSEPPRLWVVTRGAQPAGAERSLLAVIQASVWGLGKVIALEHPEMKCVRVDLDPAEGIAEQAQTLFAEIWEADAEDQIAFRRNERYVARLVRSAAKTRVVEQLPQVPDGCTFQLEKSPHGVLDDLRFSPVTRRQPGPGELEIRVYGTGLGFKDVLNALGMYPGDPGPLGSECVGKVVSIGAGVEGFQFGDEVIAVAPGSFRSYVTIPADFVVAKPSYLSFEEAATIPSAFLTAYYTLYRLAQIASGDRVLIHAAAGGVGMAAVQLAQRAGAEIFATAGNPEKRAFLKSLGVEHVMDSRSLDFAEEVLECTGGRGVDIVLNSLAGEFIPKSLSVLGKNGRFLEIGKRDIWDKSQVAQWKPDASYFVVDLAEEAEKDPTLIQLMFRELMAAFNERTLEPLPRRVFPIQDVISAFRSMSQAKHMGKIVVMQNSQSPTSNLRSDATYLVTGGLSGLGLLVARWMVEQGARHLVLMGRSGASSKAHKAIQEMEQGGAQVVVAQGDVSQAKQVAEILAKIEESMPPLRGILHLAGVLDDGVLLRQKWARFAKVMAPKVDGAWNLHTLTLNKPLDFFVLFSSAASLFGSPGQGNHSAANAFLDALAHHRQAQGLPALSINWGVWSEVGSAAELNADKRVVLGGIDVITPQQGLQVLEQVMRSNVAQVGVIPINWSQFVRRFAGGNLSPWLSRVACEERSRGTQSHATGTQPGPQQPELLRRLTEAPANQQRNLLAANVTEQVVRVIGLDSGQEVEPDQPLSELGLDSLMAVELRSLLGQALGLKRSLPATLVFDYPTIAALTDYLAKKALLLEPSESPADAENKAQKADVLSAIEGISDREVDRLLTERI